MNNTKTRNENDQTTLTTQAEPGKEASRDYRFDAITARPELQERTEFIREVIVNYRGPRRKSPSFQTPEEVVHFLRSLLVDNSREQVIALFLDSQNRAIGYSRAAVGNKNACPVHVGEVYQKAVLVGAAFILVAHNHPSGRPDPSREDVRVTDAFRSAGVMLGIPLLDHIILFDDGYYSFREQNQL